MDKEIVICAAVMLEDGYIIRGHRHNDCLRTLWDWPVDNEHKGLQSGVRPFQGFVTSYNRFVDRKEGLRIQIDADIPSNRGQYQSELYSEDLY